MTNREIAEEIIQKHLNDSTLTNEDLIVSILQSLDAKDARVKVLGEALKFYADQRSWHYWDRVVAIVDDDLYSTHTNGLFGGKRAREALKEGDA